MNIAEYQELFACSSISDRERSLYMYLRWHMDFATGIVGAVRKISYQSIREHLEFRPDAGSRAAPVTLSKDQVKRLLMKIEARGWIKPLHNKCGAPTAMQFRLVLATADKDRPQEERHMSATGGAPHGAPRRNSYKTRAASEVSATSNAIGAPLDERHTSDTSDKDPTLSRERARDLQARSDDWVMANELIFDDSFINAAKLMVGHKGDSHELRLIFTVFTNHRTNRTRIQSMSDWLADWRSWVAREKVYERSNEKRSNDNSSTRTRTANATAGVLKFAREAAEREA